MHLEMSSAKWRQICLCINVLIQVIAYIYNCYAILLSLLIMSLEHEDKAQINTKAWATLDPAT